MYYTIVDDKNRIYRSRVSEDPNYPVATELGFKLLPDDPPVVSENQSIFRLDPVPEGANSIVYIIDEHPPMDNAQKHSIHHDRRIRLLFACDWTQLPDCNLSEEKKEEFRVYRQKLRDITKQEGYPDIVTWPERPAIVDYTDLPTNLVGSNL
jgi:hypothetical protein